MNKVNFVLFFKHIPSELKTQWNPMLKASSHAFTHLTKTYANFSKRENEMYLLNSGAMTRNSVFSGVMFIKVIEWFSDEQNHANNFNMVWPKVLSPHVKILKRLHIFN